MAELIPTHTQTRQTPQQHAPQELLAAKQKTLAVLQQHLPGVLKNTSKRCLTMVPSLTTTAPTTYDESKHRQ
jgi:hypothetical protein